MQVQDIQRKVIRIADNDNTIQQVDIVDWINDCINQINQTCNASFPAVASVPTAIPAIDPLFHEVFVIFCVMKYREGDSDYTAAQYFQKEYTEMLHGIQRDLNIPPSYKAGYQYYQTTVPSGVAEVDNLYITSSATAAGNVTITLNGVAVNIAVALNDTATTIATKIAAGTYTGWTAVANGIVITFTDNSPSVNTAASYSAGTTGANGTMVTSTVGSGVDTSGVFDLSSLPIGAFYNPILVYHNNIDITMYTNVQSPLRVSDQSLFNPNFTQTQTIYAKPQLSIDISQVPLVPNDTITVKYEENSENESPAMYWWENTGW